MALRIVETEVVYIAPAGRIGAVEIGISAGRVSEEQLPLRVASQAVGVIEDMTALMAEDLHHLRVGSSFHLEHLLPLELHQPGMGEVKGDGDAGDAVGYEPFGRQPGVGSKAEVTSGQFLGQLGEAYLD
jgi:hypothetical protein